MTKPPQDREERPDHDHRDLQRKRDKDIRSARKARVNERSAPDTEGLDHTQ